MLVVVEAERRRQDAVLGLRSRGPNHVQIGLMRVNPHEAIEKLQAIWGGLIGFLEDCAVGHQGR